MRPRHIHRSLLFLFRPLVCPSTHRRISTSRLVAGPYPPRHSDLLARFLFLPSLGLDGSAKGTVGGWAGLASDIRVARWAKGLTTFRLLSPFQQARGDAPLPILYQYLRILQPYPIGRQGAAGGAHWQTPDARQRCCRPLPPPWFGSPVASSPSRHRNTDGKLQRGIVYLFKKQSSSCSSSLPLPVPSTCHASLSTP